MQFSELWSTNTGKRQDPWDRWHSGQKPSRSLERAQCEASHATEDLC